MDNTVPDKPVTEGRAAATGTRAWVHSARATAARIRDDCRNKAAYLADDTANLPYLITARQRAILRSAFVINGVADVDQAMAGGAARRKAIQDLQNELKLRETGRLDRATWGEIEKLDARVHRHYREAEVLEWEAAAIVRARHAGEMTLTGAAEPASGTGAREMPPAPADECDPMAIANRLAAARENAHSHDFLGLAYSGGGIRSAAFNLGVTQALACRGLLSHFDYLSTVSGGGYIGSWLSAGVYRSAGLPLFQYQFLENEASALQEGRRHPVQHLRDHSNYLTPRTGFLSSDVWTFGATYARNLLLNLAILVACFVFALLAIRLVGSLGAYLSHAMEAAKGDLHLPVKWALGTVAVSSLTVALAFISVSFERELRPWSRGSWRWASKRATAAFVLVLIVAGYAGSLWLWIFKKSVYHPETLFGWLSCLWVIGCIGGLVLGAFLHPRPPGYSPPPGTSIPGRLPRIAFMTASAASLLIAVGILAALIRRFSDLDSWQIATWAVPVTNLVFCVLLITLTGLGGRRFPERVRESWGRLSADMLLALLAWTVVFAIAVYGPLLLQTAGLWGSSLGAATLLGYTITALLLARSSLTGARAPRKGSRVELVVEVAPWLFMIGFALYLSWALNGFLARCWLPDWSEYLGSFLSTHYQGWCEQRALSAGTFALEEASEERFTLILSEYHRMLDQSIYNSVGFILVVLFVAIALGLSQGVDINLFSMHALYRNRLVRCFLGATRPGRRSPHPRTLLDEADDHPFAATLGAGGAVRRPYHLVNCSINLTTGERLAWQERKASSFVISPRFSGYNLGDVPTQEKGGGCFRLTEDFARFDETDPGLTLGTAMTISGAAASPNMGYHSSFQLAFLMTVFNMRLGVWAPNTNTKAKTKGVDAWQDGSGPTFGLMYLLREIFGRVNADNRYVYLSDGGHFENLGLYELVRRRCRLIVCSDASRDGEFSFEDLGNAVRKCQIDFGLRIEFPKGLPAAGTGPRLLKEAWAIGVIHYKDVDGEGTKPGYLVYLKSSLMGKEGADIFSYSREHSGFPHDTTTNQWFSESRFESYRSLGQCVAEAFLRDALEVPANQSLDRDEFVRRIADTVAGRVRLPASAFRLGLRAYEGAQSPRYEA
jgi:hypothetical protein